MKFLDNPSVRRRSVVVDLCPCSDLYGRLIRPDRKTPLTTTTWKVAILQDRCLNQILRTDSSPDLKLLAGATSYVLWISELVPSIRWRVSCHKDFARTTARRKTLKGQLTFSQAAFHLTVASLVISHFHRIPHALMPKEGTARSGVGFRGSNLSNFSCPSMSSLRALRYFHISPFVWSLDLIPVA